jgi:predicted HTH domain antitoxin
MLVFMSLGGEFLCEFFSEQRLSIKMNIFNTEAKKMPVTFTTRIEEELAKVIDEVSKEEGLDRSTVIRRFLMKAAKEWLIEKNLQEYEEGKITLWQAARKCSLSLWEMMDEAKKRGSHVPYTLEEFREDLKGLQKAS